MLFVLEIDGLLCNTKVLHFGALKLALRPYDVSIPWLEDAPSTCYHDPSILETTPVPWTERRRVWERKQRIAFDFIHDYPLHMSNHWRATLTRLVREGHQLACCSWESPKVLTYILTKLKLVDVMDVVLSAQDALNPPPHPEMVWYAMSLLRAGPEETCVVSGVSRDIPGLRVVHQSIL